MQGVGRRRLGSSQASLFHAVAPSLDLNAIGLGKEHGQLGAERALMIGADDIQSFFVQVTAP